MKIKFLSKLDFKNSKEGFGLIEIMVVVGIISMAFITLLQAEVLSVRLLNKEKYNLEGSLIAKEGAEAVRSVRDESWDKNITTLKNDTSYYPEIQNSKWILAATSPGTIDGIFKRSVIFDSVYRDSSDNIVQSGGTLDPETKKVTVLVTWNGNNFATSTSYLTDFQKYITQPSEAVAISFTNVPSGSVPAPIDDFPSNGNGDPAQSFTTLQNSFLLTRVDLPLQKNTATPSDIYAEIRNTPNGNILGKSAVITSSTIPSGSWAWITFRFPDGVVLAPVTTYYIRIRSIPDSATASGGVGTISWDYAQSIADPYPGGSALYHITDTNPAGTSYSPPPVDFGFKVYSHQ